LYRYFTSKDHLLAATLVHWVELLDGRIGQHPPHGEHPADRVLDVLDRALRAMGRQPKLVTAVFTSLSSPDPAAVGCQQQITLLMEGIISRAMGERDVPDMSDRARMIGHVWYSALVVGSTAGPPWRGSTTSWRCRCGCCCPISSSSPRHPPDLDVPSSRRRRRLTEWLRTPALGSLR